MAEQNNKKSKQKRMSLLLKICYYCIPFCELKEEEFKW